jgi:hypothetical protein
MNQEPIQKTAATASRVLTGDAAFAAAISAGVPCAPQMQDGSLVLALAHPVHVVAEGGLVKVFSRPC